MLALRFDIDSRFGLVDRTPPLLDLLDRYGVSATFFCVMGRDPQLLEGLYYRYLNDGAESKEPLDVQGRGGIGYLLRNYAIPRSVPRGNEKLLRDMVARGHEVQPHGWIHIQWQRGLTRIDIPLHIDRCTSEYERIFGSRPSGFASPGRHFNVEVLRCLEERSFSYAGDMEARSPFYPESSRILQIPISIFRTLQQLQRQYGGAAGAVEYLVDSIDTRRDYCCLYDHPDGMGDAELAILEEVLKHVRQADIETATHSQVFEAHRAA